jgi:tetratricopeptide (TPR) repeat protein
MTKKRKKRQRGYRAAASKPSMMDPRAMEKIMADLGRILSEKDFESIDEANAFLQGLLESGGVPPTAPRTALEEGQDVMYEAWDTQAPPKRIALARKALSISPDCADAYVLLAEESAGSPEEALALLRMGVEAGERALGPEAFVEHAGHFWGVLETRPYMRAVAELATYFWHTGHHGEAIDHFQHLLQLNPGDNQGIRYTLVHLLLETDNDAALEKLLEAYEGDVSATWFYSKALLTFRREGANKGATKLLKDAIAFNPFVVDLLTGVIELPDEMPSYITIGDQSEAAEYALGAAVSWLGTGGAIEWLSEVAAENNAGRRLRADKDRS